MNYRFNIIIIIMLFGSITLVYAQNNQDRNIKLLYEDYKNRRDKFNLDKSNSNLTLLCKSEIKFLEAFYESDEYNISNAAKRLIDDANDLSESIERMQINKSNKKRALEAISAGVYLLNGKTDATNLEQDFDLNLIDSRIVFYEKAINNAEEIAALFRGTAKRNLETYIQTLMLYGNDRIKGNCSQWYGIRTNALFGEIPPEPVLQLEKKDLKYKAGSSIKVEFEASCRWVSNSALDRNKGWIGLVPANTEHGSSDAADAADLEYYYIKNEYGVLNFTAPDKPGLYDIRMYDSDPGFLQGDGLQVAEKRFLVYDESGYLNMRVLNENNEEVDFFVRIKKDNDHLVSLNGKNINETLEVGVYDLIFLVDEKDVERRVDIKEDELSEVIIRINEEEPEPISETLKAVNEPPNVSFTDAIEWIGNWTTGRGGVTISRSSGKLVLKPDGSLNNEIIAKSVTKDKITGVYTTVYGRTGEFVWEFYKDESTGRSHFKGQCNDNKGEPFGEPWSGNKNGI